MSDQEPNDRDSNLANELDELARRVLEYIRGHSFCESEEIQWSVGIINGEQGFARINDTALFDILHDLEARYLIGVKRLRPRYKYYPI